MTTFLQLQTEVLYRIRQRSDLTTFIKAKLNEAVLDVMLLVEPPEFFSSETFTTSEGTVSYNLQGSEDALAIVGVANISTNITLEDRRLVRGDHREFDDMDADLTAARNQGRPRKWFRYANTINFYDKVPDDNDGNNWSIRVRYLLRPDTMSADADVFPLELEWQEPVVLRAVWKLFGILGDPERKQQAFDDFTTSVSGVVQKIQSIENRNDRDVTLAASTHRHQPSVSGRRSPR